MEEAKTPQELSALKKNRFIGPAPSQMKNSLIRFYGSGNILFCENAAKFLNCQILFFASNSLVYLSDSTDVYTIHADLYNDTNIYIGNNCRFNPQPLRIILSEQSSFFAGNRCLLANATVRTADAHLIYDAATLKRINPTGNVYVGDHVWIAQSVLLLKGTRVSSGSIIGANSVVSGKNIPHNTSWGGNPARYISSNIFWESSCVHSWTEKQTSLSQNFREYAPAKNVSIDEWIYTYDEKEYIPFDAIGENLHHKYSPDERLEYLKTLAETRAKNRFASN